VRGVIAIVLVLTSCRDTPPAPAPTAPLDKGSAGSSAAAPTGSAQAGSRDEAAPYAETFAQNCNLLTADAAAQILGAKASTLKPHVERQGDHMILCGFEGLKSAIGYQVVHWINVQAARERFEEFVSDAQKVNSYVAVPGVGDGAGWAGLKDTPALASYKGNLLIFVMLPHDQAKATEVAKKIWSSI
jgi:hypothetical protein